MIAKGRALTGVAQVFEKQDALLELRKQKFGAQKDQK